MRIRFFHDWRGNESALQIRVLHVIIAGLCAVAAAGCAQFTDNLPVQKRNVTQHIPLPNNSLLKSPDAPNCSTETRGIPRQQPQVSQSASIESRNNVPQETLSGDLAGRTKLEFERDCYRDVAGRFRKQLTTLQDAVRKTARAVSRLDDSDKVARASEGPINQ